MLVLSHHVVAVRDDANNKVYLYVDGVEVNSADDTRTGSFSSPGTSFYIGRLFAGFYLNGSIDEVAVWNRALDPDEVSQLYNGFINYLDPLPIDPLSSKSKISTIGWDNNRRGYWIKNNPTSGRIDVGACEPEDPAGNTNYPEIIDYYNFTVSSIPLITDICPYDLVAEKTANSNCSNSIDDDCDGFMDSADDGC